MHPLEQYMRQMVEMRKRGNFHIPAGFNYSSFEEYVLEHGHLLESSDLDEEETELTLEVLRSAAARGVDVHEFKQCFANSQSFVLEGDTDEFTYYEGFAIGRAPIPVHHGWVVINGKVIDLTWHLEEPASRVLLPGRPVGELPKNWAYWGFPVENLEYVRARVLGRGMIGSLLDDWEGNYPLMRGVDPNDEESWRGLLEAS
jgi:hypothetical protein